jgi:tol-pal system protein YbgF
MFRLRVLLLLALSLGLVLGLPALSHAQTDVDASERRLTKIERDLREVRDIVLQARSTGLPVVIKEAGPDPEVASLRARLDDFDQTLRQLTGQIEVLTHDLDQARKELANLKANPAQTPVPSGAVPQQEGHSSPLPPEVAAVAPVQDTATVPIPKDSEPPAMRPLELPKPAPTAPKTIAPATNTPATQAKPATAGEAYAVARQLLLNGQYAEATNALRDYVNLYGATAANAPEARYWLGETLYVQEAYADAAGAYIGALRGWPATPWAPDAVVKLALSLIALKKPVDACSTLDEFARRFPKPTPALASRAASARAKAQCR